MGNLVVLGLSMLQATLFGLGLSDMTLICCSKFNKNISVLKRDFDHLPESTLFKNETQKQQHCVGTKLQHNVGRECLLFR